jgi:type III pantothenate kinase
MILLVDVGNSRVKWLLWQAGQAVRRGHLWHQGMEPTLWGERLWAGLERPAQVLIANVAGAEVAAALGDWIGRVWQVPVQFVATEAEACGVRNAYRQPAQMGVDRWVALIGAHRWQQPCCIVDCGTAVTMDALSADGEHLGGVILPGTRLMREALFRDTRQIPVAEEGQALFLGRSTRDCVWGGTTYAVVEAIDGITGRMAEIMGGEVLRLLTGGDAEALLPYLRQAYRLEPDLLFQGLRVIAGQTDDGG